MNRWVQNASPKLDWLVVVAAAFALASCGGSIGGDGVTGSPAADSATLASDDGGTVAESGKKSKVPICHKGKDKMIPQGALNSHLGHGDTPRPCCPCFSTPIIGAAVASCSTPADQCGTNSATTFLLVSCATQSDELGSLLGVYETAIEGTCSRSSDGVNGSFEADGLTNAEYQACLDVIATNCSPVP